MNNKAAKVTLEDKELAFEITQVTNIRELLTEFAATIRKSFAELLVLAELSNPVRTYNALLVASDLADTSIQLLEVKLLTYVGQIGEEQAHELADSTTDLDLISMVPEAEDAMDLELKGEN